MSNGNWPIFGVLFTAVGGAFGAIIKHVANGRHHPSADKIVWRDLCDERSSRIEKKVDSFERTLKDEFAEVKELIRNHGQ